jgi:hypothetical protein
MDAKFMADTYQEAEEERAAHGAFDVDQQRRGRGATTAEEESDEDALGWSWPDPEEKATEQRALVTSFEEECQG